MPKTYRSLALRYGVAAGSIALATWFRLLLDPALGIQFPYATLFFAVLVTAWYGGFGPALAAVVLGTLSSTYFLIPPRGSFGVEGSDQLVGLALYVAIGFGIATLGGAMRSAQQSVQLTKSAERESEERFHLLADTIPQLAWMAKPDGYIFWYNRRWYEYTGTTPEVMVGWGWQSVHDPHTLATVLERWKESIASGKPFDMVFPLRGADGRFRTFLTRVNPLREGDGRILYWFGTNTDISEIKEMETALRDKEAHLRAIFEGSLDGIVMTDNDGRYVEANPSAGDLFGLQRDKLLGRRVSEFAEPGFSFDQEWQAFRGNGHSKGAFRLVRPDGSVRDLEFAATADVLPGRHLSILRDVTQRNKAARALHEVEQRLAAVIHHSPSCIFVKDRQGRYLLGNRALAQMVGLESGDFVGRTDADFFPSEVVARFSADEAEILKDGRPRIYQESFPYRGSTVTALTVKFPLLDTDGAAYGVCGIATDITAQERASEELAVSEERLRLALEAGHMGVWDWNIQTNELNWSKSLEPLHGLESGAFDGTFDAFQKLVHPDDREMVSRVIQRAVEQRSGYDIEFRNVWPNGSIHWISGKGKVYGGNDATPGRMIGIRMDVTERKRAEQTAQFLTDASATLAALVDFDSTLQKVASLAVPYFADWVTVDLAENGGSVRRVAVAHVDPAKVQLAHDVHRRFPSDPNSPQGLWHILRTGRSELVAEITEDLLVQSVKNEELLGILRELGLKSYIGVPLKVRGKTLGVITFISAEMGHLYSDNDLAVAEDLAGRAAIAIENTQLYLELREADRRKDEFLATLAHELRNPLAPIRNALQILKNPGVDAATIDRSREMMERQVHHLVRLVDDLLDVSRVMRGKIELRKEPVDLASIISRSVETVHPLIEAQSHELTVTLPPESLVLFADPVRLAQVVGNLLTNAAKYTERNGHIWLSASRDGDEVVIRLRDNGIGIALDKLSHIFDLFVQVDHAATRSQGGLGIGLTLVRNLVEMHHGSIEAHSQGLGRGSEFVVRLPLSVQTNNKAPDLEIAEPQQPKPTSGHRILVVDDNRDAAESLAMLLRLDGHEVRVAHNGSAALEIAPVYLPEMAFLDIGMPGMDGYQLARLLRMLPGLDKVRLAALTGWGQLEDRRRSKEAGFEHHLVKPLEPAALDEILVALKPPIG